MKSSGYIAALVLVLALAANDFSVFGAGESLLTAGESPNLVWSNNRMSPDWADAAFIGNGTAGASIMLDAENTNNLRMLLSRYDIVDYPRVGYWPRVFAGDIILAPKGKVRDRSMELDVLGGNARGVITTDLGKIQWKAYAERKHHTIIVEVTAERGEADAEAVVRPGKPVDTRRILNEGRKPADKHYLSPAEVEKRYPWPPAPTVSSEDGVSVISQPMNRRGGFVVASCRVREGAARCLLVSMAADDNSDSSVAVKKAKEEALVPLAAARKEGVAELREEAARWWKAYQGTGNIQISGEDFWDRFYAIQRYKFASATSVDSPFIIDNQGLWPWYCGWAGTWWNLNVQLSYFPTFSANALGPGKSLINGLNHMYRSGVLAGNAKPCDGITIGRTSDARGVGSQNWAREFGNLTWVLHNYWRYWKYSGDDQVGHDLFPMLKDNVTFLMCHLKTGSDGKLHMDKSRSPEFDPENPMHSDQNYALMSLNWALQTLIRMNRQLEFNDPQQTVWKETLADLTAFPVDEKTGLMVSADQPFNKGHRHYSHLLAVYPYHTLNPELGAEARALILKSLRNWHSYGKGYAGYSYTGAGAMYATLGMGDEALEKLDGLRRFLLPNTMYREGGGPVIETPLSAVETINYMLIQSWDDVIHVFPAVPSRWSKDVSFHELRTQGAFLVSARMEDGETEWVRIESLAGKPCVLETDMPKFSVESTRNVKAQPVDGPNGQKQWQIDLEKGETALLKRKG